MQKNFYVCEELAFFDLWILDSGFWILGFQFQFVVSSSGFRIPDSGF